MEREIKFRGKCIDSEKWSFGGICINQKDNQAIIIETNKGCYTSVKEVVKESVGQFTGLKDKNGVDIYEGDIILIPYNNIGLVKVTYLEKEVRYGISKYDLSKVNVAGNIHDNPELL